jgi:hypothetical protein
MLPPAGMGRTASDLGHIFKLADANNNTLTKKIFTDAGGEDVTSWGNAQRRYKQESQARPSATRKRQSAPRIEERTGGTTQVQARQTPHQAAITRANKDRRFEAYSEVHKAATREADELRRAGRRASWAAARGTIRVHLRVSQRSRAFWICPRHGFHVPGLGSDVSVDLQILFIARHNCA